MSVRGASSTLTLQSAPGPASLLEAVSSLLIKHPIDLICDRLAGLPRTISRTLVRPPVLQENVTKEK